jgi:hypothetical protein
MDNQIIYIMVNDAMPDYIKIGKTNDLERRLADLDWTNLPLPFRIYYAARVDDMDFAERKIHDIFADHRIRSNREFFKVNPERVVSALKLIERENLTPSKEPVHDPDVQEEISKVNSKRYNFKAANIPVGAELVFTRDVSVKAKVVEGGNIEVNGQIKSLSRAAQELLGVDRPLRGPLFWKYEDENLVERMERVQEGG